jgi:hypothetical protein
VSSVGLLSTLDADGETIVRGTGWWIAVQPDSPAWVVTAFHVVGVQGDWYNKIKEGVTYLLVDETGHEITLEPAAAEPEADLALLRAAVPPNFPEGAGAPIVGAPLHLGKLPARDDRWHADGFPQVHGDESFHLSGRVMRTKEERSSRTLQLEVDQGTRVDWAGVSGAPMVVDGQVVGVLTHMTADAATGWAASAAEVKALLERVGATVAAAPSLAQTSLRCFLAKQLPHRILEQHRVPLRVDREIDVDLDPDSNEATRTQLFRNRWPALLRRRGQRVLLTGVPGAGKTVSLAEFARHLVERALAELDAGHEPSFLPFWIPVAGLPRREEDGFELLEKRLRAAGVRAADLGAWLDDGRVVLLLDGLQEVAEGSERWSNLQQLLELSGPITVATTRLGFTETKLGKRWEVLQLQGLQPADRLLLMEHEGLDATCQAALDHLARRARLAEAVTVPQVWSMALLLARRDPDELDAIHSPLMLYDDFVEASLSLGIKEVQRAEGLQLDPKEVNGLFELLGAALIFGQQTCIARVEAIELCAVWLARRSEALRQTVSEGRHLWLVDLLPRYFLAVLDPQEASMEETWPGSESEPDLAFVHGSLADFLAARCLGKVYRHDVPEKLLVEPALATMLAFYFDLLEAGASDQEQLAELDRYRVTAGSLELVEGWIRHAPRERLERQAAELTARLGEELQDRLRVRVLLRALQLRGSAWARRLIQPELQRLGEAQQVALRAMMERGDRSRKQRLQAPPHAKRNGKLRHQKAQKKKSRGADLGQLAAKLGSTTGSLEQTRLLKRITALAAKGSASEVIPFLESSDTNQVRVAVVVAGVLGDRTALLALRRLLTSPNDHVRAAVARTVGLLRDVESVAELKKILGRDPNSAARGRAATALGRIGDPRGIDALIEALDPKIERNGATRGRAATALRRIGDPRVVEPLIKALDPKTEDDGVTRGSAATALGQIGDPRAVEPLIKARSKKEIPSSGSASKAPVAASNPPLTRPPKPATNSGSSGRRSATPTLSSP